MQELQKKVTVLVDSQRRKLKESEESMVKTNVKLDAINKRDIKRQQQLQK
jgi:hypothetical protein